MPVDKVVPEKGDKDEGRWASPLAIPDTSRRKGSEKTAERKGMSSNSRSCSSESFSSLAPFTSGDVKVQQALWAQLGEEGSASSAPIVQFSSQIYFVMENEPVFKMEVLRIGDLSGRSEVGFRTRDASAQAGVHYVDTSGIVAFEPGQNTADVRIPLEVSTRWDTTLEFVVELEHTRLSNAIPGRYLWQARVKILRLHGCCFPTDKFAVNITKGRFNLVPIDSLLFEYFKMNFAEPTVRRGTLWLLLADLCFNVYRIALLSLLVWLVSVVLCECPRAQLKDAMSRKLSLVCAVLAVLLPLPMLQGFRVWCCGLQVDGFSRNLIQKNLLRRFLNLEDHSREQLRPGDLLLTMTRDIELLVSKGYMNLMPLVAQVTRLLLALVLQFTIWPALGEATRWDACMPLLAFPMLLLLLLGCKGRRLCRLLAEMGESMDDLCHHTGDTEQNYQLIADYNERPFFVELHAHKVHLYNRVAATVQQVMQLHTAIIPILTCVLACVRLLVGGLQVIDRDLRLGHLLVDLLFVGFAGAAATGFYETILDMKRCHSALLRVVVVLNLKTDVDQRMQVSRIRRDETTKLREEARRRLDPGDHQHLPIDSLPIRVTNLDFTNLRWAAHHHGNEENLVAPLRFKGSIDIPQGQFVVLIGPQGEGKSTLLRLIADMILQETVNNIVFVPSHLRVLHVNGVPLFWHGTLYENLTFGVRRGDMDGHVDRVIKICGKLGLGPRLLEAVQTRHVFDWSTVLSEAQQTLLGIARALIANPEVLCIHKPTEAFDKQTTDVVLSLLKDFVESRGVEQDPNTRHLRRPRTCIITSEKKRGAELADQILQVSSEHGVEQVASADACHLV